MNFSIRPAEFTDLPGILDIVNHAIANTTAIYDYEPRSLQMQQDWFQEKSNAGFPVFVATANGKIAGFATYGTFRPKIGYRFTIEHSVYVSENAKGFGVGSALLKELITRAKLDGYHIMIGAIDAGNHDSISFHAKFGFTECGTMREVGYKFGKWLDVTLMQLRLV